MKKKNKNNKVNKKNNKVNKKKIIIIYCCVLLLIIFLGVFLLFYNDKLIEKKIKLEHERTVTKIREHYGEFVSSDKDINLYLKDNDEYVLAGKIGKNTLIELEKSDINYDLKYFSTKINEVEYFIDYNDVYPDNNEYVYDNRYKKYILFNEDIVTNEEYSLYDYDGNMVYSFNRKDEYAVIIKDKDKYGIEFMDRLLYINKSDVEKTINKKNTDKSNTKGIAVLNYHFFFDETLESERKACNQVICLANSKLREHLNYIKKNNIFTPTMKELEMYIDGKVQLPKSVVLTIDDGWRAGIGSKIITEYELNATIFLMSGGYDPNNYKNQYIEVHSHGHHLHDQGVCPGGQGGAIKCLEKSKLLEDLHASREKLDNTTVFCYPFYEYNNYSISVLKEAGFTMAFGGYGEGGKVRVVVGADKFRLPRYVIYNTTSANQISSYIG